MKDCYLLSYPRSGNHWVRYILEWFSGRPTIGEGDESWNTQVDTPIHSNKKLGVNISITNDIPIAYKRHDIREEDDRNKPLILIVRDYKEILVRKIYESLYLDNIEVKGIMGGYMDHVIKFHEWPGPKLLVHYEDLMDHPGREIARILSFLDVSKKRMGAFMRDINRHKELMLQMYSKKVAVSMTNGTSHGFYSSNIPAHVKWEIDDRYRSMHQDAFDKYLTRYTEKIKTRRK